MVDISPHFFHGVTGSKDLTIEDKTHPTMTNDRNPYNRKRSPYWFRSLVGQTVKSLDLLQVTEHSSYFSPSMAHELASASQHACPSLERQVAET